MCPPRRPRWSSGRPLRHNRTHPSSSMRPSSRSQSPAMSFRSSRPSNPSWSSGSATPGDGPPPPRTDDQAPRRPGPGHQPIDAPRNDQRTAIRPTPPLPKSERQDEPGDPYDARGAAPHHLHRTLFAHVDLDSQDRRDEQHRKDRHERSPGRRPLLDRRHGGHRSRTHGKPDHDRQGPHLATSETSTPFRHPSRKQ